jgi:hypothetical protein
MRGTKLFFLGLVVAMGLSVGCGDDDAVINTADASGGDGDGDGDGDAGEGDAGDSDAGPMLPDLDPEWLTVEPGGETICARGDEFRFFARGGTVNKLVIFFDGGGACWDAQTCGIGEALFSPTAEENLDDLEDGVGDNADPENPFRDWYQIFIPYCTADVHWGDNVATYTPEGGGEDIVINHKGQANVQAVLDWVYERFEAPESIFVTGVSAGAYGSIGWAPYIIDHYPDAEVSQLGDCGAGVITETFFEDSFPSWNSAGFIPDWIPALDVPIEELKIENLYIGIANHYPDHFFGQYNTDQDENQILYYVAMGGMEEDWSPTMRGKIDAIIDGADNFRSYIAGGVKHVILPYPEFYTYASDGVRIRDWVADIAAGEEVENVDCGEDCAEPEIVER